MSKPFHQVLFSFLDLNTITYTLDKNIVRFKDYNFSFFLVLENEENTYVDFIKKRSFESTNFNALLIFIWFDLWHSKQDIILSKITHLFGLSTKLHARKTTIELVNKSDCEKFFTKNHRKTHDDSTQTERVWIQCAFISGWFQVFFSQCYNFSPRGVGQFLPVLQ